MKTLKKTFLNKVHHDLKARMMDFVGKSALREIKRQGVRRKLVGFQMEGREIARSGYRIFKSDQEVGRVTSGGYVPTLGVNIGLGYVPIEMATIGSDIEIMIRNKLAVAHIVNKRFYKRSQRNECQGI